ncbi:MAG TPA: hypothetical protein VGQ39_04260 [Pyrinomonadaceae bacterium]|nr:hypothetical protein [Pyrinomonadaceae bacterium]
MTGSLITLPDGSSISIIKPLIGFRSKIEKQVKRFPYKQNVFLMLRFREANKTLSDFIIETLKDSGLNGVRADQPEWNLTNDVYNPIAVLYCCKYGIALFDEAETNQAYNPNVLYELGMMHCLGRKCLILRNDSLPSVPFDLVKDISYPYKGDLAVRTNVQRWLQSLSTDSAEMRLPSASKDESKLESAAVTAPVNAKDTNEIVASPENVTAAEFTWRRVLTKSKTKWTISWSIKLTNNNRGTTAVRVQILFLDEQGFALEDYTAPLIRIGPGKAVRYKEKLAMSADLAERVRRAMARVSKVRK